VNSENLTLNQLMILSTLLDGEHSIGRIAESLRMTRQGVVYHLRQLRASGYLNDEDKITPLGFEAMRKGLLDLRSRLTTSLERIDRQTSWEAISSGNVRGGDTVYLFMDNGYLHASRDQKSSAKGIAQSDASDGDFVSVTGVTGIVSMEIGKIRFYVITDEGWYSYEELPQETSELTGVLGEKALLFCRKRGLRVDIEYATVEASFDACIRGISCRVFVSDQRLRYHLAALSELSRKYPQVDFSFIYV